jgi:hypothetical protein
VANLSLCDPLYGKSVPWKKQRFIPSCAKSGISRDDGGSILAYPQSSQNLAQIKKGNNKISFYYFLAYEANSIVATHYFNNKRGV